MKTNLVELRAKTDKELLDLQVATSRQVREFKFKLAAKQLKDVRDLRVSKKLLARVSTLITERRGQAK